MDDDEHEAMVLNREAKEPDTATLTEHLVLLRITRPADGSSLDQWDWLELLDEPEVEVVTYSTNTYDVEVT